MSENPELLAIIHQTVFTSKEIAERLQEKISKAVDKQKVTMTIDVVAAQATVSQLRITANLVAGMIEENQQMLERIHELAARLQK